jgi:amino acid transporter
MTKTEIRAELLPRAITGAQYFTLCFGSIVGVAWMVVFGPIIAAAGPASAVVALLLCGVIIALIGSSYAEMVQLRPAAGGEMVYAHELGGSGAGFAAGWALVLIAVSVCVFEAVSLGAVIDLLFKGIQGPRLYTVFGSDVRLGSLIIGIVMTLLLAALNIVGTRFTARGQQAITYVRLALMLVFLGVAAIYAEPRNLLPLVSGPGGKFSLTAFLGVMVIVPFMYSGFSNFAPATEERAQQSSSRQVGRAVVGGILASTLFYMVLVVALSALVPWQKLGTMELPAATAYQVATGSPLVTKTVLIVAALGVFTAWNGTLIAGARVLFALGRARLTIPGLGAVHPRFGTPAAGIGFITVVTLVAVFLGRGFIIPAVNIMSVAYGGIYLVTCLTVLRLRRTEPAAPRGYLALGGRFGITVAAIGSVVFGIIALLQPYFAAGRTIPPEWLVLGGWTGLGLLIWFASRKTRETIDEAERWRLLNLRHEEEQTRTGIPAAQP